MTESEQAAFEAIQAVGNANHGLALTLAEIAAEYRVFASSGLNRAQRRELKRLHDRLVEVGAAALGMACITLGPRS